jgi:tetratricopeptide (TPR) repeat protein
MMSLANPITQLRDFDRAAALLEESLALLRQAENREGMVFPLMNLGCLYYDMCQPRRALEYYEQSLALSQELGETEWARGLTWSNVGEAYIALDDSERAVEVTEPVYRLFVRHHDHYCAATSAFILGRALWRLAAYERASHYLSEAERLYRSIDNRTMAARALGVRAGVALDSGCLDSARDTLARAYAALTVASRTTDLSWWFLERAAAYACQRAAISYAAPLFREALRRWEIAPAPIDPAERDLRERTRAVLQNALDGTILARHSDAESNELEPGQLIALVRRVVADDVLAPASPA